MAEIQTEVHDQCPAPQFHESADQFHDMMIASQSSQGTAEMPEPVQGGDEDIIEEIKMLDLQIESDHDKPTDDVQEPMSLERENGPIAETESKENLSSENQQSEPAPSEEKEEPKETFTKPQIPSRKVTGRPATVFRAAPVLRSALRSRQNSVTSLQSEPPARAAFKATPMNRKIFASDYAGGIPRISNKRKITVPISPKFRIEERLAARRDRTGITTMIATTTMCVKSSTTSLNSLQSAPAAPKPPTRPKPATTTSTKNTVRFRF